MNRRSFIKLSAIASTIAVSPSITLAGSQIIIVPTGGDDTDAINNALKASARIGDPAVLAEGVFNVTNTIVIPVGARLIGQGQASTISFRGGLDGEVVRIEEPCVDRPIKRLYIEDMHSPVQFRAMIG